ncbi:hypothetical protein fh0823_01170 [Francisella halioticida]|nr:hypothetical protein [Francisella halioticida]BCD89978.1 hypothetical protein fh0823_01170 [Francisella halioticida]
MSKKIATIPAIFSFLFINIFDSTGTIVGLASAANTIIPHEILTTILRI